MRDKHATIKKLKNEIDKFVKNRNWEQYHTPKNLSMCIAVEVAELMENFQWESSDDSFRLLENLKKRKKIEEELADIAIYVIDFCSLYGIDLTRIIMNKLVKNNKKYPVRLSRGKVYKYSQLSGKKR